MESQSLRWSMPSLTRHRTAILAVAAVALGYSLHYIHDQLRASADLSKPNLRRSNARRQRRRPSSRPQEPIHVSAELARYQTDAPWGSTPIDLAFLRVPEANAEVLAQHNFRSSNGQSISIPLARHLPSLDDVLMVITDREEAETLRRELELGFLIFYFWRHMSPGPITNEQRDILFSELQRDGDFSRINIYTALLRHQEGQLMRSIEHWTGVQQQRGELASNHESVPLRQGTATDMASGLSEGPQTMMDDESEHSWRGELNETDDGKEADREGQSLLNLLYRIAEEQARKDGYVHRRVTCNSCNMMPIRGIRYHCANCLDYDLCEQCEGMQIHPKTHLFYKIRIPAPFIRNPKQPEPLWYPGKPAAVNHTLDKQAMTSICKDTGYQVAEVEALWEQFRCLAATEWLDDPGHYCLAIDRHTFNKCFVPQTSLRPSPPNLIYDRMFSFYDTDGNNLIGFQEFILGLASLTKKIPGARQKRLFKGYDINNDGYVDRKDFLRLFRAYYSLTRELTRDVLAAMEDDVSENGARDIVLGSQPISSAFTSAIPQGERPRAPQGKVQDNFGDYTTFDGMGAVDNKEHDLEDPDETLADAAEIAKYGCVRGKGVANYQSLYSEPWPPKEILERDVEKILVPAIRVKGVTLPEDQKAIRRVAHARIANYHQRHSYTRRQAVRDRKQRRAFYVHDEGDPALNATLEAHRRDFAAVARIDSNRTRNLQRLVDADQSGKFYAVVKEKIEEIDWPVYDSPMKLAEEIGEMILLGWNEIEIAEALSGYAVDFQASKDFVTSISGSLEGFATELGFEACIEDDMSLEKPLDSFPWSRRSRSSSKVRFQDELGTADGHESRSRATSISSRSMPVNERWGGFDMPEPEQDVGREVLYQITQEAFNELLDPIFRLREDLALAALQTRRSREKYRSDIVAAVDRPWFLKNDLDTYQRWWRTEPFKEIDVSDDGPFENDEAATFFEFLVQREAGEENSLTCEKCSYCARKGEDRWIGIGRFCVQCGLPSRIAREEREEQLIYDKHCLACEGKGEETYFTFGANFCRFGHPSPRFASESAWLQDVILGRFSQRASQVVAIDEEENTTGDANQGSRHTPLPEAVLDLDSSVTVFEEAGPSDLKEETARKPLDELLADSGYTLATTPGGPSRPPDPTLPQNRPNDDLSLGAALVANKSPESIPLPELTLPQHRPDSSILVTNEVTHTTQLPDPAITQNRLRSSSPQPDPTLPQSRPGTDAGVNYAMDRARILHKLVEAPVQAGSPENPAAPPTQNERTRERPPDRNTLRYYAALDMIEAEDKERGGPGRLSFVEWEQVMKGEKGKALGFLGTWLEMASF